MLHQTIREGRAGDNGARDENSGYFGSDGVYCSWMSLPARILVVQPNGVGDAVMATPALRALRELYPQAHISYLLRRYVKPIYAGMPWADRLITYRTGKSKAKRGRGI